MDENVDHNTGDIFSTLSLTTDTNQFSNNQTGSSVWNILENAVNSIENSATRVNSDRDCYQSDDLSEYLTRLSTTVSTSDRFTNYQLFGEPQDQSAITESFGNDLSATIFENDQARSSHEFSNFGGDPNPLITDESIVKFSEVALPSNLLSCQQQLEKTIGGTQDPHYPSQQTINVNGLQLAEEEELLMLLNEGISSGTNISDLSFSYQLPLPHGQLEDTFSPFVIHQEELQVLL
jgi:hypothetical protein